MSTVRALDSANCRTYFSAVVSFVHLCLLLSISLLRATTDAVTGWMGIPVLRTPAIAQHLSVIKTPVVFSCVSVAAVNLKGVQITRDRVSCSPNWV